MGQSLVVTQNMYEYDKYKCVSSLQNINWEDVDVLIFNNTRDSDVDAILELSKACDIVKKLIYINSQINPLFYGMFAGANADIYNDEDMLGQEDILDFLVSDYKNTGMTIKSPNTDVDTIAKFISSVSRESAETLSKMIKNNALVQTLQSSIKSVETSIVRTDKANENMIQMFNKTSEIIDVLKESQNKTTEEIEKLNKYLTDVEQSKTKNVAGVISFPTYNVPNNVKKVFYVQVCSPCRYLVSCLMCYQDYLYNKYQKKVKFLLVIPKLKNYIKKYEANTEFTRLAKETIDARDIMKHNIFVTSEPRSSILSKFFEENCDMFIVLDMLFGEPILAGAKVEKFYAVNSISDIALYGVNPGRCFITTEGLMATLIIPKLSTDKVYDGRGGRTGKSTRLSAYMDKCTGTNPKTGKDNLYTRLDSMLGI